MMTSGLGLILADYFLAILVTLCTAVHLAILRAPDIEESETIQAIRRIKIAGFAILTMRFWYVLFTQGDLHVPAPTELGLSMIFGAELYRCIYRLYQHKIDHYQSMRSIKDTRTKYKTGS